MKKLTVITVNYNEKNLEETLESVVNQTWQDFEWIVVDGGSRKEFQDIFEKYKYRINKFISEPDDGVYNAMNKGIQLASGEYLNFLNAGDSYYCTNTLKDVYTYLKNGKADVYCGNANHIREDNGLNWVSSLPKRIDKEFFFEGGVNHQASFIKRELFDKFGLYDEKYKIVSDYEKWLEFIANGAKFEQIPDIVSNFKLGGISTSESQSSITNEELDTIILKYFSKEEVFKLIPRLENERKIKNSFLKNIFSTRNGARKQYKVITILGKEFYLTKHWGLI